jgi:ribosomal protein L19E
MLDIFPFKSKDKGDSGTSAKSDNYLTSAEKSLLSDLLKVNAATVLSFEIETDRIGEANLQDKLEKLAEKGYIKVNEEESYKIFTPTWKTRQLRINGIL